MHQLQDLRDLPRRLGDRRQWFQLGMASATVLTPLVSRWRSLRAAERARALWAASQSGVRWPWVPSVSEEQLPPLARRDVRTGVWLAGVAVGLAAAGTAAFVIARQRMRAEEEPLELPLITRTAANGSLQGDSEAILDRRDPLDRMSGAFSAGAGAATNAQPDVAHARQEPPTPQFVGNTQTLLYAPTDEGEPPPEEVRIYFVSEAQARQAGYRAASGDLKQ